MLPIIGIVLYLSEVLCSEGTSKVIKPYMFPVPLELPNRNDRADQCWLRIEDVEVTETVAVYCYIAQAYLRNYIYEYNSKKMTEDAVDVSLWSEKPRDPENDAYIKPPESNTIKDWKVTTVLDPITRMRLYVSKNADCRLIMYSREGMMNYLTDCEKVLYFINEHMTASAGASFLSVYHILLILTIVLAI